MPDAPVATGPKGVSLITEMVRRQIQADPKATEGGAPAAPVTPVVKVEAPKVEPVTTIDPAKPAVVPADDGKPRNPDGTFKEDPNKAAMREVIKRQQDELKAAREALKAREVTAPATPTTKNPREEALLSSMSKETREWYEKGGRELMGLGAQSVLAPHEAALAKANALLKQEEEDARWNSELNDWMAGKLGNGEVIDEREYLKTLNGIDSAGWRLGKTDAAHFEAVYGIFRATNPKAVAQIKTGKEAEDAARKQAEELARAGGVRPGTPVTPTPQADRAAELKALREAAFKGDPDAVSSHVRKRMRSMGIFAGQQETAEGG